jgi:hypothetical protein
METNPTKSGIMIFNPRDEPPPSHVLNYPVVNEYKHLGAMISNDLGLQQHILHITPKITYITNRLTPVRLRGSATLNANLFKVFISPLFRLSLLNYASADANQKQLFEKFQRRCFKRFMCWPINTSNRLVDSILGNTQLTATKLRADVRHANMKRLRRANHAAAPPQIETARKFPRIFSKMVQIMYSTKCTDHGFINNNAHLTS